MTLRCDFADTTVERISHDDVTVSIHSNSTRIVEPRNGPFSVSMPLHASPRQSEHVSLWCDLADTMVVPVSHNDVTAPIHCDSAWIAKLSDSPFSVWMALLASARQSGHMAMWCNLADIMSATG